LPSIRSLKGVLAEADYFKNYVNDPKSRPIYKKGIEIVEQKKIDLAEIDKDFNENKKPEAIKFGTHPEH
jgi:hypothetical protein